MMTNWDSGLIKKRNIYVLGKKQLDNTYIFARGNRSMWVVKDGKILLTDDIEKARSWNKLSHLRTHLSQSHWAQEMIKQGLVVLKITTEVTQIEEIT